MQLMAQCPNPSCEVDSVRVETRHTDQGERFFVQCWHCMMMGPEGESEREAVDAWAGLSAHAPPFVEVGSYHPKFNEILSAIEVVPAGVDLPQGYFGRQYAVLGRAPVDGDSKPPTVVEIEVPNNVGVDYRSRIHVRYPGSNFEGNGTGDFRWLAMPVDGHPEAVGPGKADPVAISINGGPKDTGAGFAQALREAEEAWKHLASGDDDAAACLVGLMDCIRILDKRTR